MKLQYMMNGLFFLFFILIGFSSVSLSLQNNLLITFFLGLFILILVLKLKINYFKMEKNTSKIYFLVLVSVFFLSHYLSPYSFDYMIYRYFGILFCIFFGIIGYFIFKNNAIDLKFICKILSLIGFVHCLFVIYLWFSVPDPVNYNWILNLPFFSNIRHLADYLAICFLASFYLLIDEEKKYQILYYINCLITLSVIIWTGSRAAYIGIFIAILLIVLKKRSVLLTSIFLLIPSLLVQYFFMTNINGMGFSRTFDTSSQSLNSYSSGRLSLYEGVVTKFLESPLLGLGPEAVRNIAIPNGSAVFAQAHNFILQILIEFGIIGFIVTLLIFAKPFLRIRQIMNDWYALILSSFIVNIVITSLFNGGFYYIVTLHLFCFFFGALLANLDSQSRIVISK